MGAPSSSLKSADILESVDVPIYFPFGSISLEAPSSRAMVPPLKKPPRIAWQEHACCRKKGSSCTVKLQGLGIYCDLLTHREEISP